MHIAALAALSAVALCTAGCDRDARSPGVFAGETFLTVNATGRADSRPDEARLQLGVQSLGLSAAEASRTNREKMDKVTAALAKLGVKPDQLQTRNLSLQRIDYGADKGRYRADNMLEVRLTDLSKVGDAIAAVTDAGANLLSGPDLRVANHEAANRSAYAAAYRAARARAEAYADAADLKINRVIAIYDGGESNAPVPYTRTAIAPQAAAPPPVAAPPPPPPVPFSPGVNSTEVSVRVDFALTRK
jgi:uncharacterized protein YggE